MDRCQKPQILRDLRKKMVFLSGPRQTGKSWLARSLMGEFKQSLYLNWDSMPDRRLMLDRGWRLDTDFLILDEIHKMEGWKSWLKGLYDTKPPSLALLVTGSARLETFRQSGDSLAGRYFSHRLLPVSPSEAAQAGLNLPLSLFMERGGFPEPLLAETKEDAGRWRRQYLDGLIREDILSFENLRDLKAMSLLVELLRERVASPLSYQSLGEDLSLSPNTVKRYIEILEALYIVFRVYPHSDRVARSILQQPKLYLFDTGLVSGGEGKAFENLVALSLLKHVYGMEDLDGRRRGLSYLRTKDGREVDFLVVEEGRPLYMVEAKYADRNFSPHLSWFQERLGIPGIQLVVDLPLERDQGSLSLRKAGPWLERLRPQ